MLLEFGVSQPATADIVGEVLNDFLSANYWAITVPFCEEGSTPFILVAHGMAIVSRSTRVGGLFFSRARDTSHFLS
jgi:hypothetical protein